LNSLSADNVTQEDTFYREVEQFYRRQVLCGIEGFLFF
jgi:hypothetical protein